MLYCQMLRGHAVIIAAAVPFAAVGVPVLDVEQDNPSAAQTTSTIETTLVEQPLHALPKYWWWVPEGAQTLNRLLTDGHSYRSMGWP